MIQKID
jgi:hypothetical protein